MFVGVVLIVSLVLIAISVLGFFIDSARAIKNIPVNKAIKEVGDDRIRIEVVDEDEDPILGLQKREVEEVYQSIIRQLKKDRIARAERLGELYVVAILLAVALIILAVVFINSMSLASFFKPLVVLLLISIRILLSEPRTIPILP